MKTTRLAALAAATLLAVAACGGGASPSPTAAPSASDMPTTAPSPSEAACAPDSLETLTAGTLTIGTDNPAYPPYFESSESPNDPWEFGDPSNGKGFESAFAYALADRLGYAKEQVAWVVVPFDTAYAPGEKSFDLDINQVSYTAERAESVDLSEGYYFVNQAVVAMNDGAGANATSIADLKGLRLGAQVGTTSYQTIVDVIAPTAEPLVYNTNDAAIQALQGNQIDALVVDLPTAFYMTAAQLVDDQFNPLARIVGQFPNSAGEEAEHFSVVLEQGSPLTQCLNAAIASMKADGTLEAITTEWLSDKANAPVLE